MPLYDFVCKNCGHEFETLVVSSASPPATCPKCNKNHTERRLSLIAAPRSSSDRSETQRGGGCGRCGDPAGPCSVS